MRHARLAVALFRAEGELSMWLCQIAKGAFDEAISQLDTLPEDS